MQSKSKGRMSGFLARFLRNAHLDAPRILRWYSYILFFVPLVFWAMLAFNAQLSKQSLFDIIRKQGTVSIAIIVTILDFLVGYYLWISRGKVLTDRKSYHFFMGCQAIGQLLVGNIICVILALFGMYQSKQLTLTVTNEKNNLIMNIVSVAMLVIFIICSIALILLGFRKS